MSEPRYNQMDSPALQGLSTNARAQVVAAISNVLLAEIVDAAGGEVVLPPGFRDRVGAPTKILATRFLDDGSYRLRTEPITPEFNPPGLGTRWVRQAGPRRGDRTDELYEVTGEEDAGGYTRLERIDEDGSWVPNVLAVLVSTDYLRRGVAGWRRWTPPLEVVEGLGGKEL